GGQRAIRSGPRGVQLDAFPRPRGRAPTPHFSGLQPPVRYSHPEELRRRRARRQSPAAPGGAMTMGASALALGGGGELAATAPDLVAAHFPAPRRVLSDAAWNGGWREACAAANHLMCAAAIDSAAAHATYCRQILVRHHLPPDTPLQLTAAPVTGGGCCQQLVDGVR